MDVWRPCDTVETAVAWGAALRRQNGPTALLLTRQNLPFVKRESLARHRQGRLCAVGRRGARAVIIATGSEVGIALDAQKLLAGGGMPVRVVSMPSTSVFDRQDADYRNSVLPRALPKVAVEAGVSDYLAQVRRPRRRAWSASTASASRRRPAICSSTSASPRKTSVQRSVRSTVQEMIKVAINGFGRIGRMVLRAHYEGGKKHGLQFVAINDLGDAQDQRPPPQVRHGARRLSRRAWR